MMRARRTANPFRSASRSLQHVRATKRMHICMLGFSVCSVSRPWALLHLRDMTDVDMAREPASPCTDQSAGAHHSTPQMQVPHTACPLPSTAPVPLRATAVGSSTPHAALPPGREVSYSELQPAPGCLRLLLPSSLTCSYALEVKRRLRGHSSVRDGETGTCYCTRHQRWTCNESCTDSGTLRMSSYGPRKQLWLTLNGVSDVAHELQVAAERRLSNRSADVKPANRTTHD
jgi:hypothetical protein